MRKRYKVTHPTLGESVAVAADKLGAVSAAAKAWGVAWTSIARQCDFEVLGEAVQDEKPESTRTARGRKPKGEEVSG